MSILYCDIKENTSMRRIISIVPVTTAMVESSLAASRSALIISLYICRREKSTQYNCDAAKVHKKEISTDNKEPERRFNYDPFKYKNICMYRKYCN